VKPRSADVNVGSTAPVVTGPGPVSAAAVPPVGPAPTMPPVAEVENFIGKEVYAHTGEAVGEIVNLLVGPGDRVRSAIVEFGGFLGIGEHQVAVAWDRLNVTGDRITVNMTEAQIRAEPRWTRDLPGVLAEFRPYR
jgi:sporulation protein YlmC with PRC-barrel domain